MSADELSILISAKDAASAALKQTRSSIKSLKGDVAALNKEWEDTGDKAVLAKRDAALKNLQGQYAAQRKYQAEVKRTQDRLKSLETQSQTTFAKMGRGWQRITRAFENPIVSAVSIGSMVLFGKTAVQNFAEAEKAQADLQLSFAKFPKMTNISIGALRDYNDEMQAKYGVDNDSLASADAVLARFDMTGQQIKQITPLVIDYAQTMGEDVVTAAGKVGRALLGNAKALKAVGIKYTATGDQARDTANIMALLEQKVGGAAEAFAGTTAGKLQKANVLWEDMTEKIGAALVPALTGALAVLTPLTNAFGWLSPAVQSGVVWFGALGVAAMVATPKIVAMKDALMSTAAAQAAGGGWRGAVAGILSAVNPVTVSIAALTGALVAYANAQANAANAAELYAGTLDKTGAATAASYDLVATSLSKDISGHEEWARIAELTGYSMADITRLTVEGGKAYEDMRAKVNDLAGSGHLLSAAWSSDKRLLMSLNNTLDNQSETLWASKDAWQAAQDAASAAAGGFDAANSSLSTQLSTLDRLTRALSNYGFALTQQGAADKVFSARNQLQADFGKTTGSGKNKKTAAKTFEGTGEDAIKNRENLRGYIQSMIDYANSLSTADAKAQALAKGNAGIRSTLQSMGLSPGEIEKVLAPYHMADTAARIAASSTGNLKSAIVGLPTEKNITITTTYREVHQNTTTGGKAVRAMGGPVAGGTTALVGELGPELFMPAGGGLGTILGEHGPEVRTFARGGYVIPHHQLGEAAPLPTALTGGGQMTSAAAAPQVHITGTGGPSIADMEAAALNALRRADRIARTRT